MMQCEMHEQTKAKLVLCEIHISIAQLALATYNPVRIYVRAIQLPALCVDKSRCWACVCARVCVCVSE